METQVNQYFMYGMVISYNTYEKYVKYINEKYLIDDVCGIFGGRDGKFIILGKVLYSTNDENPLLGDSKPFEIPKLENVDEMIIKSLVKQRYGIEGDFHYYFVTNRK